MGSSIRHVLEGLLIVATDLASVRLNSGELVDLVEERSEDIGVVVGHLALKDTGDTLEAHACIDVASGQRREASIQFTVELEMGEERGREQEGWGQGSM